MRSRTLEINEEQLSVLDEWARSSNPRLVQRTQVVLLSSMGLSAEHVSERLGVARVTVYKWRKRFVALGLPGLYDLPRSGQPRKLAKDARESLVRRTVFEIPPRGIRWSVRQLAKDAGITEHQVRRIWADHGLQPHKRYVLPVPRISEADGVQLRALVLAPPHNACVFGVLNGEEHVNSGRPLEGEGCGRRLRRSVRDLRHAEDSIFAALDRTPGASARAADPRLTATIVAILECAQDSSGDHQLHVVFSSNATFAAVREQAVGRCAGMKFSAIPLTCAWAEALEQLLSDAPRQAGQQAWAEPIRSLRRALSAHNRDQGTGSGAAAFFHWSATPQQDSSLTQTFVRKITGAA